MELLLNAYSTASDEEDDILLRTQKSKKSKAEDQKYFPARLSISGRNHSSSLPVDAPIYGRYVSKRERAAFCSAQIASVSEFQHTSASLPARFIIQSSLKNEGEGCLNRCNRSEVVFITLSGHQKAVNTVQWSTNHVHLLASAGMDHTVSIWNVWSKKQKRACILNNHNAAVKDVKWFPEGTSILSCGYDCSSRLSDIETGVEKQAFLENQVVSVIKLHPLNCNLFISGGSKGLIRLWDVRVGKMIHEYVRNLGPILDLEFTSNAKQVISSSDVSATNASENSIIIWDVARQVPLSNQVYGEAYTCTCVRCHPLEKHFVAQSNGNYIAIFSSRAPFRLDRYRRLENHATCGFPIKCNFDSDGHELASGSADGFVYFYNFKTASLTGKVKLFNNACIDVVFHPIFPGVIASCSWDGPIAVVENAHLCYS